MVDTVLKLCFIMAYGIEGLNKMRHHIGKTHRPRRGDINRLFLKASWKRKDLRRNARGEWTAGVRLKTVSLGELPDEVGNETTDRKLRGTNQGSKTQERYISWRTCGSFFKHNVGWSHDVFLGKLKLLAKDETQYRSISARIHEDGIVCWKGFRRNGVHYYSETKYVMGYDGRLNEECEVSTRSVYGFARKVKEPKSRLLHDGNTYQKMDGFWYRIGIVDKKTYEKMTCISRSDTPPDKWYKVDTMKHTPQLYGVDEGPGEYAISKHQVNRKLSKILDTLSLKD